MRRKSRHSSYNRRRRNMFGGNIVYNVKPYLVENVNDNSNINALNTLVDLGYVNRVTPDRDRYITTSKFTDENLYTLWNTYDRISLVESGIFLQKNYDLSYYSRRIEVSEKNHAIGQVILYEERF
jgi:hypothetical protein